MVEGGVQRRAVRDRGEDLGEVLLNVVPGLLRGTGRVRHEVLDPADTARGTRLGQALVVAQAVGLDVRAGGVPDGRGELGE